MGVVVGAAVVIMFVLVFYMVVVMEYVRVLMGHLAVTVLVAMRLFGHLSPRS